MNLKNVNETKILKRMKWLCIDLVSMMSTLHSWLMFFSHKKMCAFLFAIAVVQNNDIFFLYLIVNVEKNVFSTTTSFSRTHMHITFMRKKGKKQHWTKKTIDFLTKKEEQIVKHSLEGHSITKSLRREAKKRTDGEKRKKTDVTNIRSF